MSESQVCRQINAEKATVNNLYNFSKIRLFNWRCWLLAQMTYPQLTFANSFAATKITKCNISHLPLVEKTKGHRASCINDEYPLIHSYKMWEGISRWAIFDRTGRLKPCRLSKSRWPTSRLLIGRSLYIAAFHWLNPESGRSAVAARILSWRLFNNNLFYGSFYVEMIHWNVWNSNIVTKNYHYNKKCVSIIENKA